MAFSWQLLLITRKIHAGPAGHYCPRWIVFAGGGLLAMASIALRMYGGGPIRQWTLRALSKEHYRRIIYPGWKALRPSVSQKQLIATLYCPESRTSKYMKGGIRHEKCG